MRSGRKWSLFLEMASAHWEVGIWQRMLPWGKAEPFIGVDAEYSQPFRPRHSIQLRKQIAVNVLQLIEI